jgi:hypothetical protein
MLQPPSPTCHLINTFSLPDVLPSHQQLWMLFLTRAEFYLSTAGDVASVPLILLCFHLFKKKKERKDSFQKISKDAFSKFQCYSF